MRPNTYELRPPRTDAEWNRYHAIRKSCLFDVFHPWIPYDPCHGDDRHPDNHPLGFFLDGEMVGTIRIDLKEDGRAVFRMVAIVNGLRGHHLGSRMLVAAEAFAKERGAVTVCLNAVQPAIGFYERHGYQPCRWRGCTACPSSLPVMKPLTGPPRPYHPAWASQEAVPAQA